MTITRKRFLIVWGILLVAAVLWSVMYWNYLPHLPDTYSGEAVFGKVVDAETGEPIEGAIVIGLYELRAGYSMEGGIIAGHMHVEEVVTDAEGNYFLIAWGPKPRRGKAYLNHAGPRLLIFKDGYGFFPDYTRGPSDDRYSAVQTSRYTGRTIELKKFSGDRRAYIRQMSIISGFLESLHNPIFGARNCVWKQVPRIMMVLDRFNQSRTADDPHLSQIPRIEDLVREGGCGSREDFIKDYENETMDDIDGGSRD